MPKLLRAGESVDFVQSRTPAGVWRGLKLAALCTSDGTLTQLCTNHMVEFLRERPWQQGLAWETPMNVLRKAGATGFVQVNVPLSNMDAAGALIADMAYLERLGAVELMGVSATQLRRVLKEHRFTDLIGLVADQLGVTKAAFAHTFLQWLHARVTAADMKAAA